MTFVIHNLPVIAKMAAVARSKLSMFQLHQVKGGSMLGITWGAILDGGCSAMLQAQHVPVPPGGKKACYGSHRVKITINVPLFKKLRDIIFFWWENHFMSHFEGHFEGAKTFLTP